MFSRRAYCLVCSVIVSLVLLAAPTVESVAAGFDHIEVAVPGEVPVGEEFAVVVSFVDQFGKLLPEDWKPSQSLILVISKPGSVLPSVLTPENFHQKFRFLVSTYRTGPLDMDLMDKEGLVLKRWKVDIIPRRPVSKVIQNPAGTKSKEKQTVYGMPSNTADGPDQTRARVEGRNSIRPGMLDAVTVTESDSGGLVSFSTNGVVEYDVSTSAKYSRKWINVVMPKVTHALPERLEGGKNIIGEVYAEKSENGEGLRISVEVLPLRIGYELFQQGDSLILKITRQ